MAKEENDQTRAKKLQEHLAKSIHEATSIPVFIIDSQLVKKITETLQEVPEIKKNFTKEQLRKEVSKFLGMGRVVEGTIEEKVDKFLKELTTEKNYTAFVLLRGLRKYPVGAKLGGMEFVDFSSVPDRLVKHLSFLEERGQKYYLELDSWIKINFKSYRTEDLWDICFQKLELPLAALSLTTGPIVFDIQKTVGIIVDSENKIGSYLQPFESRGWSKYDAKWYDGFLSDASRILAKKTNTSLEKRIMRSIRIMGLARTSSQPQIRLLFNIASLESLLLSKNDRDYLGYKLAEKVAFLLGDNFDQRMNIFGDIKTLYRKRSAIIHGGKEKEISKKDELQSEMYTKEVIFKLSELSKDYQKIESKNKPEEQEGVEDLINKLKFNKNFTVEAT